MTCHKCKHSREIARLAEEQARLRKICTKCRLGKDVAGDGSLSLDAVHDGTIGRVAKVAPNHPTAYTFDPGKIDEPRQEPDAETLARDALHTLLACVASLPFETVAQLVQISDTFKVLTRQEFEIVAHFLNGGTMIGYAEAHGLTKQTAFARIKALFKAHPTFLVIANGGLGRGKGGRVAQPNRQADFFDKLEN
jgi:hypothetical protein